MAVVLFTMSLISAAPSNKLIKDDPSFNYDHCGQEYDTVLFFARYYGFGESHSHEMAGNAYSSCVDEVDFQAAMFYN